MACIPSISLIRARNAKFSSASTSRDGSYTDEVSNGDSSSGEGETSWALCFVLSLLSVPLCFSGFPGVNLGVKSSICDETVRCFLFAFLRNLALFEMATSSSTTGVISRSLDDCDPLE